MKHVALVVASWLLAASAFAAPKERQVGLFYFLWLGEHGRNPPRDVSRMLAEDPGLAQRAEDPKWGPVGFYHHWGEPLFGYYYSDDEWVVRRHMKLIMQSGVDFLYFDTTNAVIYEKNAKLVMRVLQEYHDAGWKTPQVMFYTNTESGRTVEQLLERIYRPCFAPDTWYCLDGKPVVVARENECSDAAREFFTIVSAQWPNEESRPGGWPWMDFTRPQRLFPGKRVAKSVMNVSVAQHPQERFGDSVLYGDTRNRGRSFHDGHNDPAPDAWKKGYNFDEQWQRAYEADPDIVLVTGWNEWIMGRWQGPAERPIMFVDCANYEYSRDIEMMRGGYGDNYLEILKTWVRRYKRLDETTPVTPVGEVRRFRCFADSGLPRDAPGYGTNYVNRTQRNVPDWIEVSHDAASLRFVVKTQRPVDISKRSGDWMQIRINGFPVEGTRTFDGDRMTLVVPRTVLHGKDRFSFKFVDSTVACTDPLDFYDHGVVEPLGRATFEYRLADAATGNAHVYPVPAEIERGAAGYTVTADGVEVPATPVRVSAMPVNCLWPGHERELDQTEIAAMSRFSISGPVKVRVSPGRTFTEALVRPLSKNIAVTREGDAVTFTISEPGGYSVEFDGRHRNLHLLVDPIEDKASVPIGPHVRRFGPGVHEAGVITLKSGDTLYLDEGAWVKGRIEAKDADHVRILGRGVIDMSGIAAEMTPVDEAERARMVREIQIVDNAKRSNLMSFSFCDDLKVEGVTLLDSMTWNIVLLGCRGVVVDNVKTLGNWRYNADGYDLMNSRDVTIRNCFLRTFDDTIVLKGFNGSFVKANGGYQHDGETFDAVENVIVSNCVTWCDWGRNLEIGLETCAREFSNIRFVDCELINTTHVALDVQNGDQAELHDIRFERINVEYDAKIPASAYGEGAWAFNREAQGGPAPLFVAEITYIPVWSLPGERGRTHDVTLRDIRVLGPHKPSCRVSGYDAEHRVAGIGFGNITWNGQDITDKLIADTEVNAFADRPHDVKCE